MTILMSIYDGVYFLASNHFYTDTEADQLEPRRRPFVLVSVGRLVVGQEGQVALGALVGVVASQSALILNSIRLEIQF